MEIQCEGWWEQDYMGRQEMTPLTLSFRDGKISGRGHDVVGPFTLQGVLHDGNVSIHKQYVGQHSAHYAGQFDGEGTMHGTWQINGMKGPWMIRIGRTDGQHESMEIKEIRGT